jgi:hypothetical protein
MMRAYAEHGLVQEVLAGWRGPDYDFNAVFPRGQVQSPKVRAFVDFLVERLNFDTDYLQVLCEEGERCQQLLKAAVAVEGAEAGEPDNTPQRATKRSTRTPVAA